MGTSFKAVHSICNTLLGKLHNRKHIAPRCYKTATSDLSCFHQDQLENSCLDFNISKKFISSCQELTLSFSASIKKGEFVTIIGESGAGKTTLLRMLAGLTKPDSGSIHFGCTIWYDHRKKISINTQNRNVGMVFQDYTLFPHMTVYDNLLYGAGKNQSKLIDELLSITGLTMLSDRFPSSLSGGQKQRVAVLRSFVKKPQLLLLDEPMSALDDQTRALLQEEILRLHKMFKTTIIMVSHHTADTFLMSNRVMVLRNGIVDSIGTPEQILTPKISAKCLTSGVVTSVGSDGVLAVISVCIGNSISKITVSPDESARYKPGDCVSIAIKAFNPVIINRKESLS